MSIVSINLGQKSFKLACPPESQHQIITLAEKLDIALGKEKENNPNAPFDLLLVMVALGLIDEQQSKALESGGEALKKANSDFQSVLSSVFSELKIVAKKLD